MLKRWIWVLLPLAAAGVVLLWNLTHPKPEPTPLRLTVMETGREIANLPHYVAASLGYFRDTGLHVTLGTAAKGVLNDGNAGQADLILTPFDLILDGKWVAVAGLTHAEPALLLAREKQVPFAWNEMSGKTVVGEHPEGTAEVAMERILRSHELIPQYQYVSIQHLPQHLRLGTYLAGTGDYIILTDPEATRMEKSGKGYIASDLTAAGRMPSRVAAAPADKADRNKEAIVQYTQAIAQAQAWMAEHTAEEVAVAASRWFPWVDHETMVEMVTRAKTADLWPASPLIRQAEYNRLLELLTEAGELPAPIAYDELVRPEFVGK